MTDTPNPDDVALAEGLAAWLTQRRGLVGVALTGIRRPSAGYSSETVFVDVTSTAGTAEQEVTLVCRMAPKAHATFERYDLEPQWQAQEAAAAVGVPVADPVLERDSRWIGAPFIVMPWIDGHLVGSVTHLDRWLGTLPEPARGDLYRNFLSTLARIHRADVSSGAAIPRRDNSAELDFWDGYLRWSSGGSPVAILVDGLRWCRQHQPSTEPEPALLWGDVRLENTVFGDDLVPLAVLDWDMTSIGAPEHDLAWFTSLDLTMEHLFGERVAGFPLRSETIALFEEGCGRPVRDLEWYETLAMVRSTALMTRIGYLRRDADEPLLLPIEDNPILTLLRGRLTRS